MAKLLIFINVIRNSKKIMSDERKIKLIIFDWDDVFTLGSKEGYYACYHQALEGVGVQLKPEKERKRILTKWGQSHREELKELLKEHSEFLDDACLIYEKNLFGNTFMNFLTLTSGSKALLENLHKKYILTIASGINPKILNRVILKFGIPDVFSKIVTIHDIDDPKKAKPHPYIAQNIMETQKILPNETVLVGDARGDVLMAQAANIIPIVVLTGHLNKNEAEKLGVKYIIPDVTHLEKILDELNKEK